MKYNPFSLENKTIFITGASSGIGKSIALECSKMGANLVITGRNAERLNNTFTQFFISDFFLHQSLPVTSFHANHLHSEIPFPVFESALKVNRR